MVVCSLGREWKEGGRRPLLLLTPRLLVGVVALSRLPDLGWGDDEGQPGVLCVHVRYA